MAQLSGIAPTIENEHRVLVPRQFALELIKLAVRDTDSRGDVPFHIFWTQRSGVYENHLVAINLLSYVFC